MFDCNKNYVSSTSALNTTTKIKLYPPEIHKIFIKLIYRLEINIFHHPTLILSLFISLYLDNKRQSMQIFQGIFNKNVHHI